MKSWAIKSLRLDFIGVLAIEAGRLLMSGVGCSMNQVEDADF